MDITNMTKEEIAQYILQRWKFAWEDLTGNLADEEWMEKHRAEADKRADEAIKVGQYPLPPPKFKTPLEEAQYRKSLYQRKTK